MDVAIVPMEVKFEPFVCVRNNRRCAPNDFLPTRRLGDMLSYSCFHRVWHATPCAYDRSGNIVSAVTEGVATNFYVYCEEGLVTNEVQNGAILARSYDSLGRPAGYVIDGRDALRRVRREVSYTYDALGRLASVSSGTNVFTYTYLLGTDLVSGYTCGGFSRTVAYEPYRDLVSAITNRFGIRVISTFEYTNDAAGRHVHRQDREQRKGGDADEVHRPETAENRLGSEDGLALHPRGLRPPREQLPGEGGENEAVDGFRGVPYA